MSPRLLVSILVMLASVGPVRAQIQYPPETKNAALRYWMAFSEMRDVSAAKSTQELLEKTVSGQAEWDEKKLGPILDANKAAIDIMQRATRLPDCDWGLDYSQGPRASIAYAPRARALSRLNTLEGMRQLAAGDSQSAVNTWLAGIRFSQDVARGGSLIFSLIGKSALMPNLRALTDAASKGKLTGAQRDHVLTAIRALPEDVFGWSAAWGIESATVEQCLHELQTAADPRAAYQALVQSPAPVHRLPPTAHDIHDCLVYMRAVQSALREPPEKAKVQLESLESERSALGDVERSLVPNPQKANLARIDVMQARAELLQALARK